MGMTPYSADFNDLGKLLKKWFFGFWNALKNNGVFLGRQFRKNGHACNLGGLIFEIPQKNDHAILTWGYPAFLCDLNIFHIPNTPHRNAARRRNICACPLD